MLTKWITNRRPGSNGTRIDSGRRHGGLRLEQLEDRCLPSTNINEFTIGLTPGGHPDGIVAGPDGNLWFTEPDMNRIGTITPAGVVTEFPLPNPNSQPIGILAGPDGNLWFSEYGGNRIGTITPTGSITEYPLPTPNSLPSYLTVGPDGNIWFTEQQSGQIGRISPDGQTITEFPLPTAGSQPTGITTGPDDNLWFTEYGADKVGSITPDGQAINEFPLTPGSAPIGITTGPDGNLWFAEYGTDLIGSITTGGQIAGTFGGMAAGSQPWYIVTGPDGNLWFTEYGDNKLGVMGPDGTLLAEYATNQVGPGPVVITLGPDGSSLWFAGYQGGYVGQVAPNATITAQPTTLQAVEGTQFSGLVGTFTDDLAVGNYTITIQWGDGSMSAGTFQPNNQGGYNVLGAHTYAEEGSYTVQVLVTYPDTSSPALAREPAMVADAPLSATGTTVNGVEGNAFSGTVATLTDGNPNATAGEFSVMITWGDGQSSAGTLTALGGGQFTVSGSHVYADENPTGYVVGVSIRDIAGGSTASAASTAVIADAPLSATGTTFNGQV
jgi:streptogramin lyase